MARARIEITDFLGDPVGSLERARETGWLADLDGAVGVVRHEDVRDLLTDDRLRANFPEFLRTFGVTSGPFYEWMSISPLNHDGESHKAWRAVMSRTFTPRGVERIRPFLRDAAHELIDGFASRGACEFMGEFADVYPSLGLCELIGVPTEDRDRFRGWANTIGLGFNAIALAQSIERIDAALVQLLEYTGELAAARRRDPQDDLVTRIAQAGAEDGWTDEMVRGAIAGLVFAGHETTKNQLGWMIAVLAEHADVWRGVADGSLEAAAVVEEVLRVRSTVTSIGRTVREPVERKGERLEPGTQLLLSLWSANHDEATYAKPQALEFGARDDSPHLAFGHGAHHCLGAALARAELQEGLAALAARIGCPRISEGATWTPPVGINGPERLPITFTTA